ncbi:hypothetical protein IH799_03200 [candidate division KSB1 bacterium]|nr:hypothetical protein [candidate division KSB1 bacterium]
MKNLKKFVSTLTAAALLAGLAIHFNACTEQSPLSSQTENSVSVLAKGKPGGQESEYNYPLYTDLTLLVNSKGEFQGGQLKVENGTTFSFTYGSLTPPSGWTDEPIILSMEVDMDTTKNEMLFTFGPSGCQFNPSAISWFNYGDLGISAPKLYYIDSNGKYIEQAPEKIDYPGNKMLFRIEHFSRYAIGAE